MRAFQSDRGRLAKGRAAANLDLFGLRDLRLQGVRVLSRLYFAVRDRDWGTRKPQRVAIARSDDPDGSRATITAWYGDGDIDLQLTASFVLREDGLDAALVAVPGRDLEVNRIGFCVLHPLSLAGVAVAVETPSGVERASFPRNVAPRAVLRDVTALSYSSDGVAVRMAFAGDLFETEDQRNWTDASFKTYSTPLRLPRPRILPADEAVRQSISIEFRGAPVSGALACAPAAEELVLRFMPDDQPRTVAMIGSLLRAGCGARSTPLPATMRPPFWRAEIDLRHDWPELLDEVTTRAQTDDVPLDVMFVHDTEDLDTLRLALERLLRSGCSVRSVGPFARWQWIVTAEAATAVHDAALRHERDLELTAGSVADFSQLLRNQHTLEPADRVTFGMSPQVHVTDDRSIMESVATYATLADCASRLAGRRQLEVGPITLAPRFRAGAVPHDGRLFDGPRDSRIDRSFAGAWTVAALAALLDRAHAVVLHSYGGPESDIRIDESQPSSAAAAILAVVRKVEGWSTRRLECPVGIAAWYAQQGGDKQIVIANLGPDPVVVRLAEPPAGLRLAHIDQSGCMVEAVASGAAGNDRLELTGFDVAVLATS